MVFQGIRTSNAKKPYIFVIFQRGIGPPVPLWICASKSPLIPTYATPRENLTLFRAKNEDADQPVHPISACISLDIPTCYKQRFSILVHCTPLNMCRLVSDYLHVSAQSED